MICVACGDEFGDGETCANCRAYDGESDVDRTIRVLGEDNQVLDQRLQELTELIRNAERAAAPENFEENDHEIETLHSLIRELAAAVDGHS